MKPGCRVFNIREDHTQGPLRLLFIFLLSSSLASFLPSSRAQGLSKAGEVGNPGTPPRPSLQAQSWVEPAVEFVLANWPSVNASQESGAKEAWSRIVSAAESEVPYAEIQTIFCDDDSNFFICNGSTLTKLNFLENPFSASLVLHSSLCELTTLQELVLSFNPSVPNSSIPACLGQLTDLRRLGLQNMSLVGSIPESLGSLSLIQGMRLGNNNLVGSIPDSFSSLTDLVSLQLQSNQLSGPIPEYTSSFSSLRVLHLFQNNLTGVIPSSLGFLSRLEDLRLSSNPFFGSIPDSLGNLGMLTGLELDQVNAQGTLPSSLGSLLGLRYLSITQNSNLSGTIPESFNNLSSLVEVRIFANNLSGTAPPCWASFPSLTTMALGVSVACPRADGQPCCGGPPVLDDVRLAFCQLSACRSYCTSCTVYAAPPASTQLQPGIIALIACMGGLFLVLVLVGVGFLCWWRHRQRQRLEWEKGLSVSCRRYTWEEVVRATRNFSRETFLGKGGFGSVHRGQLDDGMLVAVKRASRVELGSAGRGLFEEEVQSVHHLSHRSLVRLLGYCSTNVERILVYELMPGGALSDHIFESYTEPLLSLEQRVLVAGDVAEGLKYLHNFASVPLVHRDIKAENVLLDDQCRAKIADFGLARKVAQGASHHTRIAGTTGYMDPGLLAGDKISPQSDVYSFGVLLLELITGRRAIIRSSSMSPSRDDLTITGSPSAAAGTSTTGPSGGADSTMEEGGEGGPDKGATGAAGEGGGVLKGPAADSGLGEKEGGQGSRLSPAEGWEELLEGHTSDEECVQHISMWVEPLVLRGDAAKFGDCRVCREEHHATVLSMARLALECVRGPGVSRPSMADVCQSLHETRQQMLHLPDMNEDGTSCRPADSSPLQE